MPNLGGCVSELVLTEARLGDKSAAEKRLVALEGIPVLETGPGAVQLSRRLVESSVFPEEYINDALHITIAADHSIEFLVTWNCKHLANATIRGKLNAMIQANHLQAPVICTPEELMEDF